MCPRCRNEPDCRQLQCGYRDILERSGNSADQVPEDLADCNEADEAIDFVLLFYLL